MRAIFQFHIGIFKKLALKYNLPKKDTYELVTQYNSLVEISDEVPKQILNEKGMVFRNSIYIIDADPEPEIMKSSGIKIDVLMRYNRLLSDKHPDIVPRILKGVGVDVGSKNPRVSMKSFLNLN